MTQYYLTSQDEQTYGRELIDFASRAAAETVAPHLQYLQQQNADLERRLAEESRHRINQALNAAIGPSWRTVNASPEFHQYLRGTHELSNQSRQRLLDAATARGDAPAIISLFRGFLNSVHAHPAAERAQSRSRSSSTGSSDKPFYTRQQIAQNYRDHQRGLWAGREADWGRLERDMIAAAKEGRAEFDARPGK